MNNLDEAIGGVWLRCPISTYAKRPVSFSSWLCNTQIVFNHSLVWHMHIKRISFRGCGGNLAAHALGADTPHGNECHPSLQRSSPSAGHARPGSSTTPPFPSQARSVSQHLPSKGPAGFCWMAQAVNQGTRSASPGSHQPGSPRGSQGRAESLLPLMASLGEAAAPQLPGDGGPQSLPAPFWYFGPLHSLKCRVWLEMCSCRIT